MPQKMEHQNFVAGDTVVRKGFKERAVVVLVYPRDHFLYGWVKIDRPIGYHHYTTWPVEDLEKVGASNVRPKTNSGNVKSVARVKH